MAMIDCTEDLSVKQQALLLAVNRTSLYSKPAGYSEEEIRLRHRIDFIHNGYPTFGSRRIRDILNREGWGINRKAVQRRMREMCIQTTYPGPNLSKRNFQHRVFPYLLRNLTIDQIDQVWQIDITYIRLAHGWLYMAALIDVHSRFLVDFELSTTIDKQFVLTLLKRAFTTAKPYILNSDQGSQFTCDKYIDLVKDDAKITISMDGKGRATDNIYIERFWRTLKQDEIYLNEYGSPKEAKAAIGAFVHRYNYFNPHAGIGQKTPGQIYSGIIPLSIDEYQAERMAHLTSLQKVS